MTNAELIALLGTFPPDAVAIWASEGGMMPELPPPRLGKVVRIAGGPDSSPEYVEATIPPWAEGPELVAAVLFD